MFKRLKLPSAVIIISSTTLITTSSLLLSSSPTLLSSTLHMSLIVKETNDKSVYVLSLENNKFYVGISSNVQRRWLQHKEGVGALWTRLHKPIKIVTVSRNASSFEEDKLTKLYMSTYGIQNVRGGSYVSITLSNDEIRAIKKELLFASNRCIRCEAVGHYVKNCSAPSTPTSSSPRNASSFEEDKLTKLYMSTYGIQNVRGGSYVSITLSNDEIRAIKKELLFASNRCIRCEAVGHYVKNCSAPSTPTSSSPSLPSSPSPVIQALPSPSSSTSPEIQESPSSDFNDASSPAPLSLSSTSSTSTSEKAAENLQAAYTTKGTICKLCIDSISRHTKLCRFHTSTSEKAAENLQAAYTKRGTLCKLCIDSINRHTKLCRFHDAPSLPEIQAS